MIKIVPPLEYNELLDSGTQLRVVGNEVQLDARKLGGPGGCPQMNIEITGSTNQTEV